MFERPALLQDPGTGQYKLYGCCDLERRWAILKFDDADDPTGFDPRSAKPVLMSDYPDDGFIHVTGYKDPFILWDKGLWHMFVIGTDRVERIYHFTSRDGETWDSNPTASANFTVISKECAPSENVVCVCRSYWITKFISYDARFIASESYNLARFSSSCSARRLLYRSLRSRMKTSHSSPAFTWRKRAWTRRSVWAASW